MSSLGCSKDNTAAIEHRLAALHGMSSAMQSLDQSEVQDQSKHDALFATCMLFQFQSTFISDGLEDYLIMGRGTGLLTQRVQRYKTIDDWQLRNLRDYISRRNEELDAGTLAIRTPQAAALASSLAILEPSCLTADEREFCTGMQNFAYYVQQPPSQRAFRLH